MAIVVPCSCGKKIKAPDGSEGRRAKCPNCGSILTIPLPEPELIEEEADDAGYELADDPFAALAPTAPLEPLRVKTAEAPPGEKAKKKGSAPAIGKPAAKAAAPAAHPLASHSKLYAAASAASAARDAESRRGLSQGAQSAIKLGLLLLVVGLVVGAPVWFLKFGPGVDARITSVTAVDVVPILAGLETSEPFSLVTGTGNRQAGIKGPKLKQPTGMLVTTDLMYHIGGGETLVLATPSEAGSFAVVEADISHGLITSKDRIIQYKATVNQDDFRVAPVGVKHDAPEAETPQMLFARFDDGATVTLDGPRALTHDPILPPGIKPFGQKIETRKGGAASGTIVYDGSPGATGSVQFTAAYFASGGAPGVTGVSATGKVTRTMPGGATVDYIYRGESLEVDFTKGAGRTAWWTKHQLKEPESFNPWDKVKLAFLVEKPADGKPLQLTYMGEPVGTIDFGKAARSAKSESAKPAPTPPPTAGPAATGIAQTNPAAQYMQVLIDARKKARGIGNMSNMNQVGMAIFMYAEQNGGRFPPTLYDLRTVMPEIDSVLVNYRTGEKPGFIYEPPDSAQSLTNPQTTPILWEMENGQKAPNGSVLYADGHIESPLKPGP